MVSMLLAWRCRVPSMCASRGKCLGVGRRKHRFLVCMFVLAHVKLGLQALFCPRQLPQVRGRTMAMLDECHEQLTCLRTAARAQADTCIVLHTVE